MAFVLVIEVESEKKMFEEYLLFVVLVFRVFSAGIVIFCQSE